MRLTAIELENFKRIGPRQRIELKPITLLFGPNSAGKSTILQALHYVREILERKNVDPDRWRPSGSRRLSWKCSRGDGLQLSLACDFLHHRISRPKT